MAESVQAKLSRSRNGCVVKCYLAVQSCFVCASASTVICCGVLLWRPNLFSPGTDIISNHILQLYAKLQRSALCKQYAEHSSSHFVLFWAVITWSGYWLRFRGIVVRFLVGANKRSKRLSAGVKRPWREADRSPTPTAKFQNEWSYTSSTPYASWRVRGMFCSYSWYLK